MIFNYEYFRFISPLLSLESCCFTEFSMKEFFLILPIFVYLTYVQKDNQLCDPVFINSDIT